jgi:hypothetical protein
VNLIPVFLFKLLVTKFYSQKREVDFFFKRNNINELRMITYFQQPLDIFPDGAKCNKRSDSNETFLEENRRTFVVIVLLILIGILITLGVYIWYINRP